MGFVNLQLKEALHRHEDTAEGVQIASTKTDAISLVHTPINSVASEEELNSFIEAVKKQHVRMLIQRNSTVLHTLQENLKFK